MRHGETEWNAAGRLQGRTDIPLNETGMQQAEACGEYLKTFNWDVMLTSPLERARQTAEIMNRSLQLPLYEINEFIERDFGDAEGMNMQEIIAAFPDRKYPNKEDGSTLLERIMLGLDKINEQYQDSEVLLVTHGAVINTLFASLSDGKYGRNKLKLENASISNLRYHEDKWDVIEFNQCSHLTQLSQS